VKHNDKLNHKTNKQYKKIQRKENPPFSFPVQESRPDTLKEQKRGGRIHQTCLLINWRKFSET
jgi:hypothetical protein